MGEMDCWTVEEGTLSLLLVFSSLSLFLSSLLFGEEEGDSILDQFHVDECLKDVFKELRLWKRRLSLEHADFDDDGAQDRDC